MNEWFRRVIEDACVLRLGPKQGPAMAEHICEIMVSKRLAAVPTYLSDEMFDRQREIDEDLAFAQANKMWTAAVKEFNRPRVVDSDMDKEASIG